MDVTDDIEKICAAYGLELARVELHGDVAVVVPANLDEPLAPETLAGIAEEVRQFGIKHVAIDIEGSNS